MAGDERAALLRRIKKKGSAKAVLVMVDVENPSRATTYCDPFEERDGLSDPMTQASRLWDSIKGDWPKHQATVLGNDRAKYLQWVRRMKEMIGGEHTAEEYVDVV